MGNLIATDTYYCEVTDACGVLNTNTVTITVWDDFNLGLSDLFLISAM
ncbi:MAG: hypothetical protein R2764_00995 [Bacteroidales bacterium]